MIRRFIFADEINYETASRLLAWLEDLHDTERGIVLFDSNGGCAASGEVIIEALNERKYQVEVEAMGELSSQAFIIFMFCENKKRVNNFFRFSMIHQPDTRVSVSSIKNKDKYPDKFPGEIIFYDYERLLSIYDGDVLKVLKKKEKKKYKKGDDIFFGYKRTKKLADKMNEANGHDSLKFTITNLECGDTVSIQPCHIEEPVFTIESNHTGSKEDVINTFTNPKTTNNNSGTNDYSNGCTESL